MAPPTLNLDHPSRDSVIDRVAKTAQERQIRTVLSNSFGFGGTNASVIFRAPPDPVPPHEARPLRLIWLRVALSVTVVGTASAVGLGLCLWWLTTAMHAPGPMAEARAIVVPHGATAELTDNLAADGLIERKMLFRAAVWLTRTEGALHAAEFAFPAHASVYQVLEILRIGQVRWSIISPSPKG